MKKYVAVFFLLAILVSALNISVDTNEGVSASPSRLITLPTPIRVDNNSMFFNTSEAMKWTGDGSSGAPFIISGYEIPARGYGCGIYIGNVTYSFIIRDCRVHNVSDNYNYYYWGSGIAFYNVSDARIENCYISDSNEGTVIGQSSSVTVNDTRIENAEYDGIRIFSSEDLLIRNNIVRDTMTGITVSGSTMVTVSDNDLRNGEGQGINIGSGVTGCNMTGNLIHDYSMTGILISDSGGCRIIDNDIVRSNTGIALDGYNIGRSADQNVVKDNTITQCHGGIHTQMTRNSLIEGNNISYSTGRGIEIGPMTVNETVRNNILWHNTGYGAYLMGEGHLVYNNNFHFNNGSTDVFDPAFIQGYDEGLNDTWYRNGKGNTWSDRRGPDEDENGIVDIPYPLHGRARNSDPYPVSDYEPPILFPPSAPRSLEASTGRLFINLTWQEPQDDGGSPILGYNLYRGAEGSVPEIIAELPDDTFEYNDTDVLENTRYGYRVTAVNDIGEGPFSSLVHATTPEPPGQPEINITSPEDGRIFTSDNLTVSYTYNIYNGNLDHIDVNCNGFWIDVGNSTSYPLSDLADGQYLFRVRLFTMEGLEAEDNITFNISVPSPVVEITAPGMTLLNDDPITFSWNTGSSGSRITSHEYRMDGGNWTDVELNTTISLHGIPEGPHIFEVRVRDVSGRNGTASITLTVDRTPPNVMDKGPIDRDISPDTVIYVTFGEQIVDPSAEVRFEPEVNGTMTITNHTFLQFVPDEDLEAGVTYTVHVQAMDAAGNLLNLYSWDFTVGSDEIIIRVFGYIVDDAGNEVQGAIVTLKGMNDSTNGFGQFEFLVPPGSYHLSVFRDGYKPYDMDLIVASTGEYNIGKIILEKEYTPEEDSSFPWAPVVIVIIGAVIAVGFFSLKRQGQSDELDIEE
ncbi:MAG: right-handed parallel beta-helix repeat-containing protein [Candidatus Thermoplasmatota archaeon]|nr:right-handed parallel beta-helix repeat-containing protein [Candidatus Thermoplasmatota archaeon]